MKEKWFISGRDEMSFSSILSNTECLPTLKWVASSTTSHSLTRDKWTNMMNTYHLIHGPQRSTRLGKNPMTQSPPHHPPFVVMVDVLCGCDYNKRAWMWEWRSLQRMDLLSIAVFTLLSSRSDVSRQQKLSKSFSCSRSFDFVSV